MDNQENTNLERIRTANREMLNHFNREFLSTLEAVQELKTQSFEIDIKIDELEKTKDIYAFKTTSRKSVFTPVISDGTDTERGKIIDSQINDLLDAKDSINTKIRSMESKLNTLKQQLATLNDAEKAIEDISSLYVEPASKVPNNTDDGFEFIEEDSPVDISSHGYNILMLDAFDKAYLSTMLDKNVKDNLSSLNHKLDLLSYLISTDAPRAKLTLQEVILNSKKIINSLDDINVKLGCHLDQTKHISVLLDEYIMHQRDAHPECIIDANVEATDFELELHPVFTINIMKLLDIFFDNIYLHSQATQIELKLSLSTNVVDVYIDDNGVGIDNNYLTSSPWYSSLHKAHETIYLLGGTLNISGDVLSGTKVRFKFPVKG